MAHCVVKESSRVKKQFHLGNPLTLKKLIEGLFGLTLLRHNPHAWMCDGVRSRKPKALMPLKDKSKMHNHQQMQWLHTKVSM